MNIKALRSAAHLVGESVKVSGWVRTLRKQKKIAFIEINDGSSVKSMQVVLSPSIMPNDLKVGSSLEVVGELRKGVASHAEMEVHAMEKEHLNVL